MANLNDPFAVLVCLHCTEDNDGDVLVMLFGPAENAPAVKRMRKWWAAHRAATGHTWAWCNEDGESPPPDEAERQARQWMAENLQYAPRRQSTPPKETR